MSESLKVTLEITYYKVGITGIVLGLLVTGLATFFAGVQVAVRCQGKEVAETGQAAVPATASTPSGLPPPATDAVAGEDPTTNDIVLLSRLLWEIGIRNANRDPVNAQAIVGRTATHLSDVFKIGEAFKLAGAPVQPASIGEAAHNTLSSQPLSAAPATQPAGQQQALLSPGIAQPSSDDHTFETCTDDRASLLCQARQTSSVPRFSSGHRSPRDTTFLAREKPRSRDQESALHRRQDTARTHEKLPVGRQGLSEIGNLGESWP
ncbi:MAG: hypothetical protein M1815_003238 [Lichina confinis]|nr:MAG: hypothetical protein M1815_003238 [Lichina confinis]